MPGLDMAPPGTVESGGALVTDVGPPLASVITMQTVPIRERAPRARLIPP